MQYETGEPAGAERWYLAYTEPRREAVAQFQLQRQGYETYLPLLGRVEPMFPRYLFFRPATPAQSIAPVRSTRGVQAVVRFGAIYARVTQDLIDLIRQQETRNRDVAASARRPRPGERVRLHGDQQALTGLEGLVHSTGAARVVILMEILGRQTRVKVAKDSLEVI